MYRVVEPLQLTRQLRSVWSGRLQAAGWQGCAVLDTGMGAVALDMHDGDLALSADGATGQADGTEVHLTHRQSLAALLLGIDQAGVDLTTCTAAGASLLQALFPPAAPVFWGADGF